MAYDYKTERPFTLTDEGTRRVVAMYIRAQKLCAESGVVQADKLMAHFGGDSWSTLACLDRLVEMGLLRLVPTNNRMTQHQVYEMGTK